ncbi:MAG TPA: glycosyltransferase family 4 protein [Pyrinomonadaceae bacterium]|jgi:hypothetical protein|nr:glycosyltransferase family 4 protein [Pyrinomonadaceae bacterium]
MNIAYFSHYFTPEIGAPSARIYDLAQQWLKSGHQVQVATCFPNHPTGRLYPGYQHQLYLQESLDGIDVHRHWTYVTPNTGIARKSLGHFSFLPSAALLTWRHLSSADVAIGTSPTFFAAVAAARFARRRKIPFIMEVRDLWPALFTELGVIKNRHVIRLLERWEMSLYRRATKVVVVTEAFRKNLISRGVPAEKVFTIPNGADVDFWSPQERINETRKQLGLENHFVVLYIGAHGISQGLESVLKSAHQLRDNQDIKFVFVGEGARKNEMVRQARQLELHNVRFLDSVDKDAVKGFYAMADVCLVPLRKIPIFDGFIPSKMFEIMAMARPIVASLSGEAAEILQKSGGAKVVEPENSGALSEAIRSLYHDRDETMQMGKRGRDFVVRNYSREALAATYISVLNEAKADYCGNKK